MGLAEAAKVALPAKVRDDLEKRILEDAFGDNIELSAENLEILGFTPVEISNRLIAKLPKDRPSFRALRGVTHGATVEDLLKVFLMKDLSQGDTEEVANALRAREDSIDELISIGNAIAKRGTGKPEHVATWMQAIAEVILERCAAAKRVPPKEVDNLLTLSWYNDGAAPEILATLPVERLRARVKSVLFAKGENPYRYQAITALAYCFDEALYEQAITIACTYANTSRGRLCAGRPALGLVGKPAIPALERALVAVSGEFTTADTVTLRKALMVAHLVAAGEHGTLDHTIYLPFPEAFDFNFIEETFFGGYFAKAMAKLPAAQAKVVIRAWLAADKNDRVGTRREIEIALGDDLKDLLGPAETAVDRIERLAKETGLPRTLRLYVLDRDEKLVAGSKNRIAAMPLGVTAPLFGKKSMEHVFTLDLDDAPEIRKLSKSLAKARGVALFISSRSRNKASTPGTAETKLVALSAKELAAGHDDDGASFSVHAVDVPDTVFGRSTKVAELRRAIESLPCRARRADVDPGAGSGQQPVAAVRPQLRAGEPRRQRCDVRLRGRRLLAVPLAATTGGRGSRGSRTGDAP